MEKDETPVVGICVPTMEMVDTDFALSLVGLVAYNRELIRDVTFRKRQAVHRARNWLARYNLARAEPSVTHLLWCDDDHVFPADSLPRLLAHDKDIVGCMHRLRRPPYRFVGALLDSSADPSMAGGLHRAAMLGGGLLLVKRGVYEALKSPWYREISDPSLAGTDSNDPDNVDGDVSEDVYFCREAQKAGFEIWCDLDLTYEVRHKNGAEEIWFRNPPPLPPYPLATQ